MIRDKGLCVACMNNINVTMCGPIEIHHLTVGDKHGALRLGHDYTVGLGAYHHRGVLGPRGTFAGYLSCHGPSLALHPREFRRLHDGAEMLDYQNELIGWTKEPQRERVRRNGSPTARPSKSFRPATEAKTLSDEPRTLEVTVAAKRKRASRCTRPEKRVARPAAGFVR